jgi:hypothetical protein
MKNIAKWITIIWSILCLIGVMVGLWNIGEEFGEPMEELEELGLTIGVGCGMFFWLIVWAVIAVPALVIWVVSGKNKENLHAKSISGEQSLLCRKCGLYSKRTAKFCSNCGEAIQD